jgi:hypothetical protein
LHEVLTFAQMLTPINVALNGELNSIENERLSHATSANAIVPETGTVVSANCVPQTATTRASLNLQP